MPLPDDALRIVTEGITINCTSTAVTPTLLPTNSNGDFPRAVRVQADTNPVYVKIGPEVAGSNSAVLVPTLNSILVHPNNPVLLSAKGMKYVGGVTRGAQTGNINITAIDL